MFIKIRELIIKYKEIITYLIFGVVTTLVNWAVYTVCVKLMSLDLSHIDAAKDGIIKSVFGGTAGREIRLLFLASLIAWAASVLVAFVTNKLWVFESRSWNVKTVARELWEFVAARILTGVLEWFGTPALVLAGMNQSLLGIEGFWAKALVSVIVVAANYVFSKLVVFKKNNN